MNEDPIGFLGADPNLNRYVGNQPTRLTDPSGHIAPVVYLGFAIFVGIDWLFPDTAAAPADANDMQVAAELTARHRLNRGMAKAAVFGSVAGGTAASTSPGRAGARVAANEALANPATLPIVGGVAEALSGIEGPGLDFGDATRIGTNLGNNLADATDEMADLGKMARNLECPVAPKGLANQNPLYKAAAQPFKSGELSNAGRALTKHPELVGATKDTLRQALRTDQAINDAAHGALRDIMRNGVTTTPTLGRYGTVTQIQIPGGFGARWASDGTFIGFINP